VRQTETHTELSFDKALEGWLAHIERLDPEIVAFSKALGRILARDLHSDIDVSPFDNSAMDGFALRSDDITFATKGSPVDLEVITCIAAGDYWEGELQSGQVARIMTGAPIPTGADTVVKAEDTMPLPCAADSKIDIVRFSLPSPKGFNIRLKGEEIEAGECVLKQGECLSPAAIGLLAATGNAQVPVYRQPVVGIISTGEELIPVTELPVRGKIRNTNSHSLAAQAQAAGAKVQQYENISDTLDDTMAAFKKASAECDLIISSGGVSVGDFDFVERAVRQMGDLHFTSVKMRPGKPQTTGTIGGTPFFGLPGNPASAYLGFELFIRPAILKMAGHTLLRRPVQSAVLEHDIKKRLGLRYFMRGEVDLVDGQAVVRLVGNQSSALLSSLHKANCLLVLPEEKTQLNAGCTIDCIRLDIEEGVKV